MPTKSDLIGILEKSRIGYDLLESGEGWMVVAPDLAARIMGAGVGEENAFWTAPSPSAGPWGEGGNSGGQRSWISPEAGPGGIFFSEGGSRWNVPRELDPGDYRPIPAEGGWKVYRSDMTLTAADGARYPIALTRRMRFLERPRAEGRAEGRAEAWPSTLRIWFRHELMNKSETTIDKRIGLWSIIQLPCAEAGTVLLGLSSPPRGDESGDGAPRGGASRDGVATLRPYFSALPPGVAGVSNGVAWLKAEGGRKYKVGLGASDSSGRIAYLRRARLPGDDGIMVAAMKFSVDPDGKYLDKNSHSGPDADRNGDAAQAYNDPGTGDLAFCEIEAHAPAPRLFPGESLGADIEILIARVDREKLGEFMSAELGMDVPGHSLLR